MRVFIHATIIIALKAQVSGYCGMRPPLLILQQAPARPMNVQVPVPNPIIVPTPVRVPAPPVEPITVVVNANMSPPSAEYYYYYYDYVTEQVPDTTDAPETPTEPAEPDNPVQPDNPVDPAAMRSSKLKTPPRKQKRKMRKNVSPIKSTTTKALARTSKTTPTPLRKRTPPLVKQRGSPRKKAPPTRDTKQPKTAPKAPATRYRQPKKFATNKPIAPAPTTANNKLKLRKVAALEMDYDFSSELDETA